MIMGKILCFLGFHNWCDNGWMNWKPTNGILECSRCGKTRGELIKGGK